jgi:hypothetical protein
MEKWFALVRGMPSHLHEDEIDVCDLSPTAIVDCLSSSTHTTPHLCQLVSITKILDEIYRHYYTIRAMRITAKDLHLSLDLARNLRGQLKEWLAGAAGSFVFVAPRSITETDPLTMVSSVKAEEPLDGRASAYLSYIVTHMTLFRALLRPIDRWHEIVKDSTGLAESMYDGAKAVVRGALQCVRDFVEFLEGLRNMQWNAFWHSWSRPNFAIAGSFMVHLLHITSASLDVGLSFTEEYEELRSLAKRWRMANRVAANGAAGVRGLASLGLLRVETLLGKILTLD